MKEYQSTSQNGNSVTNHKKNVNVVSKFEKSQQEPATVAAKPKPLKTFQGTFVLMMQLDFREHVYNFEIF